MRSCMACELVFSGEGWLARWFDHIRSAEHDAVCATDGGRARIRAFWAAKDLEKQGMLF